MTLHQHEGSNSLEGGDDTRSSGCTTEAVLAGRKTMVTFERR
jgi:hypothetical protein